MLRESLQNARDTPPPTPAPAPKQPPVNQQLAASTSSTAKTPLSESQRTDVGAPTASSESEEADSSAYTSTSSEVDGDGGEASSSTDHHPLHVPTTTTTRANTIADSWVSVQDDE